MKKGGMEGGKKGETKGRGKWNNGTKKNKPK
jgi:hypothetical protein